MPDWLKIAIAVSIPLALLVGGVTLHVSVWRRTRRYYADHPERMPRGRRYVRRVAPFAVMMAILVGLFIATEDWYMTILGLVGLSVACRK